MNVETKIDSDKRPTVSDQDVADAYAYVAHIEAHLIPRTSMNSEQIALWYGSENRGGILKTAYTTIEMRQDISAIMVMAGKFRNTPLEERRVLTTSIRDYELGHLAVVEETALAA